MSNEERSEYMRNVRWTTALYCLGSVSSILLGIAGAYFGLKGDIKDNRIESREQITYAVTSINKKQDSTQHHNEMQFQAIWSEIKNMKDGDRRN